MVYVIIIWALFFTFCDVCSSASSNNINKVVDSIVSSDINQDEVKSVYQISCMLQSGLSGSKDDALKELNKLVENSSQKFNSNHVFELFQQSYPNQDKLISVLEEKSEMGKGDLFEFLALKNEELKKERQKDIQAEFDQFHKPLGILSLIKRGTLGGVASTATLYLLIHEALSSDRNYNSLAYLVPCSILVSVVSVGSIYDWFERRRNVGP